MVSPIIAAYSISKKQTTSNNLKYSFPIIIIPCCSRVNPRFYCKVLIW